MDSNKAKVCTEQVTGYLSGDTLLKRTGNISLPKCRKNCIHVFKTQ